MLARMSNLCEICGGLDFAKISCQPLHMGMSESFASNFDQYYLRPLRPRAVQPTDSVLTPYHETLHSLVQSTRPTETLPLGCHLCNIVLPCVEKVLKAKKRAKDQGWVGPEIGDDWSFFVSGRRFEGPGMFVLGHYNIADVEGLRPRDEQYTLMAVLEFRVAFGSALSHAIRNFSIVQSPCNSTLMERARAWIQDCRNNHTHSNLLEKEEIGPRGTPTRLLQLTDEPEIILLNEPAISHSRGIEEGGYVALSHCWGNTPTLRLTTSNINQLRATGIALQNLPRTFQDAVWVTRSLGYRQLWIGSLCILQDDRMDWKRESLKMHSIYRQAAVVVAASRATDSAAGFLGPRIEPKYVRIPYLPSRNEDSRGADVKQGEVSVCISPLQYEYSRGGLFRLREEPLSQRAWALQERILASRVVHFTSEGLYLECKDEFIAESTISLLPSVLESSNESSTRHIQHKGDDESQPTPSLEIQHNKQLWTHARAAARNKSAQEGLPTANDCNTRSFRRDWQQLVSEFSRRLLTYPSDKLPAIAGMAAYFVDVLNESLKTHSICGHDGNDQVTSEETLPPSGLWRYCAGLFFLGDRDLFELLWSIDFRHHQRLGLNRQKSSPSEILPCTPPEYRAPSWSWASVDGAVEWYFNFQDAVDLAVIKSVDIKPSTAENVYGEVTSACLTLQAIICSLHLNHSDDGYPQWYILAPGTSNIKMSVLARWDIGGIYDGPRHRAHQLPESVSHCKTGETDINVAILCVSGRDDLRVGLEGIVLKPSTGQESQPGGFERLGAAFIRSDDDFTGSMEYLHLLEEMFNKGEGMSEVLIY